MGEYAPHKRLGGTSWSRTQRRLHLESLEDRSLMAALATDWNRPALLSQSTAAAAQFASAASTTRSAATASPLPAALIDDAYEQNDFFGTARNLGTLTAPTTIGQLVMADSSDWYRFTTTGPGTGAHSVAITFQHAQGNLNLALYNSSGVRVRLSAGVTSGEQVSLSGLAAGTYYIRVYGYLAATNPSYALSITPPAPLVDDAHEENDSRVIARGLGMLTAPVSISNLAMADSHDWYRFTTSGTGTSADFVQIDFQHAQGNLQLELYDAAGFRLASSAGVTNSERISLAGRAAGSYYVHVFGSAGALNPQYSLLIDPPAPPAPPTTPPPTGSGAFDIQFAFSGLTTSQRAIFEQAAHKWESIIVGDLPSATYNGLAVDDLLIGAASVAIDGRGGVLGQAGPDRLRTTSRLPYHGVMEFDAADMASMEANGTLLGVILHEMGHVLGIGTIWETMGLLTGAGSSNPRFIGSQAVAAYNAIFGTSATGVPVENTGGPGTRDGHWRESVFSTEIMTGWIGPGSNMPISRITVASLADLGYSVNIAAADPYTPPGVSSLASVGVSSGSLTSSNAAQFAETHIHVVAPPHMVASNHGVFTLLASTIPASQQREATKVTQSASAVDQLFAGWSSLADELRRISV